MIYEFKCDKMHVTEVYTNDYDLEEVECKVCGEKAVKIPTMFNGKGWDKWRLVDDLRDKAARGGR